MDELEAQIKAWEKRKSDLITSINATMKEGKVDKDVLEVMKELVENVKIKKVSMEEYFGELNGK